MRRRRRPWAAPTDGYGGGHTVARPGSSANFAADTVIGVPRGHRLDLALGDREEATLFRSWAPVSLDGRVAELDNGGVAAVSPSRAQVCRSSQRSGTGGSVVVQYGRSLPRPGSAGRAEIAQLVEHVTENHGVASSILALGTTPSARRGRWSTSGSGSVGRASPCQGEGRGFESRLPLHFLRQPTFEDHSPDRHLSERVGRLRRGANQRSRMSMTAASTRADGAVWTPSKVVSCTS